MESMVLVFLYIMVIASLVVIWAAFWANNKRIKRLEKDNEILNILLRRRADNTAEKLKSLEERHAIYQVENTQNWNMAWHEMRQNKKSLKHLNRRLDRELNGKGIKRLRAEVKAISERKS